jgi:hypothetical protein
MRNWLIVLWCTTVLPFATLPWLTIAREQPQPWYSSHALFHVVYMPIIAVAILAAGMIALETSSRLIKWLAWLLIVAESAAFLGHLGELISVSRHGGIDAGEDVFDETLHSLSASLTVPALIVGIALVLVMTVVAVMQGRRSRATEAQAVASDP